LKTSDFYYDLPKRLIAQEPASPRDGSRLLVYDRASGKRAHRHFYDLPDYLGAGDVLVVNRTRVLPARLYGVKTSTGGRAEFLLLKRVGYTDWEAAVRPAKRAKPDSVYRFGAALSCTVLEEREEGIRLIRFAFDGVFEDILNRIGKMPLPHYIKKMPADATRYQTVYAKEAGSSAAPTAGLHFTPALLAALGKKGVEIVEVLLHVGLGTFRPVKAGEIERHHMHSEYFELTADAADRINAAKADGRRVIAVGTTSVRVIESAADEAGRLSPQTGETAIFIYPPYSFKVADALITNFHLPESTLLMLVCAFVGREQALALYQAAVQEEYRFFSFGDAMLLV
jgi:S-adenosylmethionine:tRNA ribosyltransferase-isomerase